MARAPSQGGFGAAKCDLAGFGRHKILKSRLVALSKAGSHWYIPPATQGHLPRVAFSGSLRTRLIGASGRWPNPFRHSVFRKGAQRFIAGWSSPVARQAHNLKVIGSNPIPATKIVITHSPSRSNHWDGFRFSEERSGRATELVRLWQV